MDGVKRYSILMHRRGGNTTMEMVEAQHLDAALAREAASTKELTVLNEHIELLAADLAWSENDSRDQSKELAALREELARVKGISDNYYSLLVDANQSLTAAEQRNARYESLLRQIIPCLAMSTNRTAPTYIREINEALPKPTESGSSE